MSVAAPPAAPAAKSPAQRDSQRIYSIAELSREFAITPRTIRFYEDEGLIKPRRQGMTRLYSAGDRTRLSADPAFQILQRSRCERLLLGDFARSARLP